MKKLYFLPFLLAMFIVGCEKDSTSLEEQNLTTTIDTLTKGTKVDVCHKGIIKNISVNALSGHQGHGDAVDMDGDGYFDIANDCSETDCDDTNGEVNPGMEEVCDNGIDDNCDGQIDENCVPEIGDLVEGGVVFYIAPTPTDLDGDGSLDIGLVCALSDHPTFVEWGCFPIDLPSVPNVTNMISGPSGDGAEIGWGMSNTNAIIAECSGSNAASAARTFGPEWFLPSILELNEMYRNRATLEAVDGFSTFNNYYWSSTERDQYTAWLQNFFNGAEGNSDKNVWLYMRAVRVF